MTKLDAAGAPASPVNWPEDIANDPQVQAMNLMPTIEHPLTGPERHVGPLVEMQATPTGSDRAAPVLDAETDQILREHGLSDVEISRLRAANAIGVDSSQPEST